MIDRTLIDNHLNDIVIPSGLCLGGRRTFEETREQHPALMRYLDVRDSGNSAHGSREHTTLTLSPGLRVHASRNDGCFRLRRLEFNPGKLLRGHNAAPVTTDDEVRLARERAIELLRHIVDDPEQAATAFPDSPDSRAYYRSVELPFHLLDSDRTLRHGFRQMSHPRIRDGKMWVKGETWTLKGSDGRKIIAYSKDLEVAPLVSENEGPLASFNLIPILRLEVTLTDALLTDYFTPSCFEIIEGQDRMVRFSISEAHSAFLGFVNGIQGVFFAPVQNDTTKIPTFIARLAQMTDLTVDELVDQYRAASGVTNSRLSAIRRESRALCEEISPMCANELFNREAFDNQPSIHIRRLEAEIEELCNQAPVALRAPVALHAV